MSEIRAASPTTPRQRIPEQVYQVFALVLYHGKTRTVHVRFAAESGHQLSALRRPLSAESRHS
jgi:hypothetical protein